jgi:hypothetical protein
MATYTLISSVTVGSGGAATIEFTSIPATYTDLLVKASVRTNNADSNDTLYIKPNGSTANLTYRVIRGDGAAAYSFTVNRVFIDASTSTANTFGNTDIYIPNYASSNFKSMSADSVQESNATEGNSSLSAILWSDTTAISSLTFAPLFGTLFVQYSTAYLYGISNA